MDRASIYTIGYGNRTLEEFLALLQGHAIRFLIDVRSRPYSRFKPEFSKTSLEERLKPSGIQYVFLGDKLGGLPDDEACYTNGRVNYEKCREQTFFREGMARLRTAWEKNLRIALMCSEGKPEECHRSVLIGTNLVEDSIGVSHIDEKGKLITHEQAIERRTGGQLNLFGAPPETLTSRKRRGTGYICRKNVLPDRSVGFWVTSVDLARMDEQEKTRYKCQSQGKDVWITYVGFEPAIEFIPQGSLVRVSLARWWKPDDDSEERCYLQLSGWYGSSFSACKD